MKNSKPLFLLWIEEHPTRAFVVMSGALVLFLYWRAFHFPFVYDDLDQIVNNPNLVSWSDFARRFLLRPVALTASFSGPGGSTYRPLFWLSIFIDHVAWGLNAGSFHATNVALHLANGNLFFALLRRLRMSAACAAGASLLWLSLPVNTEVVAWVSGRSYALCAMFVLLCLLSGLKHVDDRRLVSGLACFGSAVGAVLSNELGIVVLPLLLVVLWVRDPEKLRKLPLTAGLICLALIAMEALRFGVGVQSFTGVAPLRWAVSLAWQYVALTFLPLHMSVERSTSVMPDSPAWLAMELAGMVIAVGGAFVVRRRDPAVLGGLAWFAISIAPFCVLLNYQGAAERFTYLAAFGLVTAFVAACCAASKTRLRLLLLTCAALWSVWNLCRTSVRVRDWSDPVRLFRSSLEASPRSPSLHYNLAFSLRERGDLDEALREYQKVLEIRRDYPNGFASLGDVYLKLGSLAAAQAAYREALTQNPSDTAVLLNSGVASQREGAFGDAEAAYRRVLALDASSSAAHVNLGVLYLTEERSNDAAHQFAMAIDLKTKDPVPFYDLGVLLQKAGRGDLALVLYKKVLELRPNDEETLRNIQIIGQSR